MLLKFGSVLAAIVGAIATLFSVWLAAALGVAVGAGNEEKQNIEATKSAREIALSAARLVPQVYSVSDPVTLKIDTLALEVCLKRLQAFPIDKLQPAEITHYIIDVEVGSQVAISFGKGEVEVPKATQSASIVRTQDDILKIDDLLQKTSQNAVHPVISALGLAASGP